MYREIGPVLRAVSVRCARGSLRPLRDSLRTPCGTLRGMYALKSVPRMRKRLKDPLNINPLTVFCTVF